MKTRDILQHLPHMKHIGLFNYKRLIIAVNSAAEILQKSIADILNDIHDAQHMSDDIIMHGKTNRNMIKFLTKHKKIK